VKRGFMGKFKDLKFNIQYSNIHIFYWFILAASTIYVVPLLRVKGFQESQIGIILSAKYIGAIVSQVIISHFADKYSRVLTLKKILICLCFISLPLSIVFYMSDFNFVITIIIYFIFGSTINGTITYINAIATRFMDIGRTVYYSYARGFGSIAWGVGSVIISYCVEAKNVEIIMVIQAIMIVLLMIAVCMLEPIPQKKIAHKDEDAVIVHSYWYLFRNCIGFDFFLIASMLLFIGYTLQTTFLVDIVSKVGGGNVELGYIELVQSICELLPAILYIVMMKKMSTNNILRISAVFAFLMTLFIMLSQNVNHLMLLQICDIFGFGMYWPTSVAFVYKEIEKHDWVKGQALVSVCSLGVGGVLGTILSGNIMQEVGIDGLLKVSTLLAALGVVFMFIGMHFSSRKDLKKNMVESYVSIE